MEDLFVSSSLEKEAGFSVCNPVSLLSWPFPWRIVLQKGYVSVRSGARGHRTWRTQCFQEKSWGKNPVGIATYIRVDFLVSIYKGTKTAFLFCLKNKIFCINKIVNHKFLVFANEIYISLVCDANLVL